MSKKSKRARHAASSAQSSQQEKASSRHAGSSDRSIWITVCMLLLLTILPEIYSRETMDPVMAPRYIFLAAWMFLFVLYYYVFRKAAFTVHYPGWIKIVFITGIAFCIWSMAGVFMAVNPVAGYYEILRHWMNLLLLFLMMLLVSRGELNILSLCKALLLVAAFHAMVGILQFYELAFLDLPAGAKDLPYGFMSNRNLFGSAQVLLLPFSVYVLYSASRPWKVLASVILLLIMISVLLSQTRSAWLATLAVIVIPFILVMVFSAPNRKRWFVATLSVSAITALLVFAVLKNDPEGKLLSSVTERASSITDQKGGASGSARGNISERLLTWQKTRAVIKDHPVTGVGFGNWKIMVPAYGTGGLIWAKGLIIPDRPHNVYLQVAAETGIPGAVLFFGMWALVALLAIMLIVKPASEDKRVLAIVMLSGLAAFAVDCMFSFPAERVEHTLYLAITGGIILGLYAEKAGMNQSGTHARILSRVAVAAMLLLAAANMFMGIKKLNYEIHMNYAKAYEEKKRYNEELAEVEAGQSSWINLDPNGTPLEARAGIAYRGLKDYSKAITSFNEAAKKNPNSPMVYNNLGTVYTESGDFNKAILYYNKALKLAPEFDIVMKNLALNYFNVGKYDSCIIMLQRSGTGGDAYLENLLAEARRRAGK